MSADAKKSKSGWLNLLVDYGPVLVFFLVYRQFSPADKEDSVGEVLAVIKSTGSFMVAAVIALAVSKWKLGRISPMLWLSTALIVFFGAITILLQDKLYIQIKPTAIYSLFGVALLWDRLTGRPGRSAATGPALLLAVLGLIAIAVGIQGLFTPDG